MVRDLVWTASVAGMTLVAACSLSVDPATEQCTVPDDCTAIGFPEYDCIESVCVSDLALGCRERAWIDTLKSESLDVSITSTILGMRDPIPGLAVRACDVLMAGSCQTSEVASAISDSNGVATLRVYEGFRGHYEIAAVSGSAPYILHMNPPPNSELLSTLDADLLVTSIDGLKFIASGVEGVEYQFTDNSAHLFFSTRDCAGRVMSGVRVEVENGGDENEKTVYLEPDGSINAALTESTSYGRGAIINITPGSPHRVKGYLMGELIFSQSMLFESNTITSTQIVPTKI